MLEPTIEHHADPEYADPAQKQLEDLLEERLKGPFIPIPDDLADQVMEKVMARVRERQATQHHHQ